MQPFSAAIILSDIFSFKPTNTVSGDIFFQFRFYVLLRVENLRRARAKARLLNRMISLLLPPHRSLFDVHPRNQIIFLLSNLLSSLIGFLPPSLQGNHWSVPRSSLTGVLLVNHLTYQLEHPRSNPVSILPCSHLLSQLKNRQYVPLCNLYVSVRLGSQLLFHFGIILR